MSPRSRPVSQKTVRNSWSDKVCISCLQAKPRQSKYRKAWSCRICPSQTKNAAFNDNCQNCNDADQGFGQPMWVCHACDLLVPSCQISCVYCNCLYWICDNTSDHDNGAYVRNPMNSICLATSCSSKLYQHTCQQCVKSFTSPTEFTIACSELCQSDLTAKGRGGLKGVDGQQTRSQSVIDPAFYSEATHALKNSG
jgi:hypothetical protein